MIAKFLILSATPAKVCTRTTVSHRLFARSISRAYLIHAHARVVGVRTEPYDDDAVVLGEDGLVHRPTVF